MGSIVAIREGCADDVGLWRNIVKNNKRGIKSVPFFIVTNETWLPNVLVQTGFFPSGNMVKKNRKDLWRDLIHQEIVKLSWAQIRIFQVDWNPDWEENP